MRQGGALQQISRGVMKIPNSVYIATKGKRIYRLILRYSIKASTSTGSYRVTRDDKPTFLYLGILATKATKCSQK